MCKIHLNREQKSLIKEEIGVSISGPTISRQKICQVLDDLRPVEKKRRNKAYWQVYESATEALIEAHNKEVLRLGLAWDYGDFSPRPNCR
jgi:hypothetical protein